VTHSGGSGAAAQAPDAALQLVPVAVQQAARPYWPTHQSALQALLI
jgi:hypothetical protein